MTFSNRSIRSGSWRGDHRVCGSARRSHMVADVASDVVGFRVVCLPAPPTHPLMVLFNILRGGSWSLSPRYCRSACRDHFRPDLADGLVGFRVVCLPDHPPAHRIMTFFNILRGGSWGNYPRNCRSAPSLPSLAASLGSGSFVERLLRGGSWYSGPRNCRSAHRNLIQPDYADDGVGFRVVCLTPPAHRIMTFFNILRGGSWLGHPGFCRSAHRDRDRPDLASNGVGFRVVSPPPPISMNNSFQDLIPLVQIPAGDFLMGSPDGDESAYADEKPQHRVTVPAFQMGRTPVTQAQWRAVATLPKVDRDLDPSPSHFTGDDLPVERVSWHDAMEFCARLSQRTGRHYTLPTEAQWEYACRAGTTTAYNCGKTISKKDANFNGNKTTPVGSYRPNAWGLGDMHGTVWEWCLDQWHNSYDGAPTDGSAWEGDSLGKFPRVEVGLTGPATADHRGGTTATQTASSSSWASGSAGPVEETDSLGKFSGAAPGSTYPTSAARPSGSAPSLPSLAASLGSGSFVERLLRGGSWGGDPRDCRSAHRDHLVQVGDDYLVGFRVMASLGSGSFVERLLRGGSWGYLPWYCRSALRDRNQPGYAGDNVGFRVICLLAWQP